MPHHTVTGQRHVGSGWRHIHIGTTGEKKYGVDRIILCGVGQCREFPLISATAALYTRRDDVNPFAHVPHPATNPIFEPVLCRPPVAGQTCSPTLLVSGKVSVRGSRQRGSGVENGVKTKQGLPPGAAGDVSTQPNGSIGRTTQRESRSSTRAAESSLVAFCEFAAGHPFRSRVITSTRHTTSPTES